MDQTNVNTCIDTHAIEATFGFCNLSVQCLTLLKINFGKRADAGFLKNSLCFKFCKQYVTLLSFNQFI